MINLENETPTTQDGVGGVMEAIKNEYARQLEGPFLVSGPLFAENGQDSGRELHQAMALHRELVEETIQQMHDMRIGPY